MKVTLKNIGKKYEGRESFTIRNIDLEIGDKEFCVILGPSSCGKSTLLRMIAGLNSITEGELIFGDKLMNKVAPSDRDIAMVFQSYALYPHMTVYDNMAFSLKMKKERKEVIHERVIEAAEILQISDYLYSRPSDISGGQRQRVALGRAMVRKPGVFLMDEPLSNLDAKLREHMRVELVRLHKKLNTTSIYVTHDQTEAMTMATKIVLLDNGKIQQVGSPEQFYSRPENLFVAEFIGMPKINKLHAQLSNEGLTVKTEHLDFCIGDDELKVTASDDKEVILAFRPESVEIVESGEDFVSEIDVIENLGSEKYLYLENKMALKVASSFHLEEGQQIKVKLKRDKVHIFDRQSELRIE